MCYCPGLYNSPQICTEEGRESGVCSMLQGSAILSRDLSAKLKAICTRSAFGPLRVHLSGVSLDSYLGLCTSCTGPTWHHIPAANGLTVCFAIWGEVEFPKASCKPTFTHYYSQLGLTDTRHWGPGKGAPAGWNHPYVLGTIPAVALGVSSPRRPFSSRQTGWLVPLL